MILELLKGAILKLLLGIAPSVSEQTAEKIFDTIVGVVTTPEEFWVAFNITAAELSDGTVPSILQPVLGLHDGNQDGGTA